MDRAHLARLPQSLFSRPSAPSEQLDMESKFDSRIAARVAPETRRTLEDLARSHGWTLAGIVRRAIEQYVESVDDTADVPVLAAMDGRARWSRS